MSAITVPMATVTDFFGNTSGGVVASSTKIDAAIQTIIDTINFNAGEFNTLSTTGIEALVLLYAYSKAQTDALLAGVAAGTLSPAVIDAIALSATTQAKAYTDAQIIIEDALLKSSISAETVNSRIYAYKNLGGGL